MGANYFKMTFQEIIDRLKAEQIRFADIVRHDERRPEWLGKIKELNYEEGPRTKDELRNHQVILHLLDHDLYIRAHGTKDGPSKGKRNWEYELTQVGRKTEEVPPRPAYTKVWYEAIYPVQTSGYPDPSTGFPSYYAKEDAAHQSETDNGR